MYGPEQTTLRTIPCRLQGFLLWAVKNNEYDQSMDDKQERTTRVGEIYDNPTDMRVILIHGIISGPQQAAWGAGRVDIVHKI